METLFMSFYNSDAKRNLFKQAPFNIMKEMLN